MWLINTIQYSPTTTAVIDFFLVYMVLLDVIVFILLAVKCGFTGLWVSEAGIIDFWSLRGRRLSFSHYIDPLC